MKTTRRFPKLVTLLCAVSLTFAAAACGDDDDDDDDVIDYDASPPPIDADTTPDAPGPDAAVSTRSGTVSVTELVLINSAGTEAGWYSGANVLVSYVPFPPTTLPQVNTIVPPGVGCSATHYNIGGGVLPDDDVDEGAVTIGGDAILHPIGACDFVNDAYLCITGVGTTAAGDTVTDDADAGGAIPANTALVNIAGTAFTAADVGRVINLTGFDDATNNGAFPIVSLGATPPTTQIVVGNPASVTGGTTSGGSYTVLAGEGPTPAQVPFLDSTNMVEISKEAGTETEQIAVTEVTPGGDGFRPDDTTIGLMTGFDPTGTAALSFGCDDTDNGACGTATGTIISVVATNGTLGANPFDLPIGADLVNVSCRAFGESVDVPVEVLDLIEGISPTRIRTTLFRANFALAGDSDGTNETGMVAGYGYIGFTDP